MVSATCTGPTCWPFSTELGADGFVTSLSNPLPELAVAIWDAARGDDAERAFRLQSQFCPAAPRRPAFGPMLACLEVICRHRGLAQADAPGAAAVARRETASRVDRGGRVRRRPARDAVTPAV